MAAIGSDEVATRPASKRRGADDALLGDDLDARVALQRVRALRNVLACLTAIVGAPLWIAAMWPVGAPPGLRLFAVVAWPGWAAVFAAQLVAEARMLRHMSSPLEHRG